VQERLREATGEPWRVVNLSITGAKMIDVVERQLPAHEAMLEDGHLDARPSLVTCFVGANDVLNPVGRRNAARAAARLISTLPAGTLLSKVGSRPVSRPKASAINREYRRGRDDGHVGLFQPWDWPTMRGAWAQDRFHPNDTGYEYLTEAIWPSVADQL
jgi:lysophospholipase L1-like esterase